MKIHYILLLVVIPIFFARCGEEKKEFLYPSDAISFSQDFILAIKTEQPYSAYRDTLAEIDLDRLSSDLSSSNRKLAFWINTYNALVQAKIRDDIIAFDDKDSFFQKEDQVIGGALLSLNQIENGILRRKKVENNQVLIDRFKVDELDPRIHFTLNCGATSCPPVAYYSVENLNEELALAEQSFVSQSCKYNEATNEVEISELFKWFEEDFGERTGVIDLLKRLKIIPALTNPRISYSEYNWNLDIENY